MTIPDDAIVGLCFVAVMIVLGVCVLLKRFIPGIWKQ